MIDSGHRWRFSANLWLPILLLLAVPCRGVVAGESPRSIVSERVMLPSGSYVTAEKDSVVITFRPGVPEDEKARILRQSHLVERARIRCAQGLVVVAGQAQEGKGVSRRRQGPAPRPQTRQMGSPNPQVGMAPFARTAKRLTGEESVLAVTPNLVCTADFNPGNKYFDLQWNLVRARFDLAWDLLYASADVVVAVLDSGVAFEDCDDATGEYTEAPELASVSFVDGYDFINDDACPDDDFGHGTHIASIIAAGTGDSSGIAGAAFGCSIMPVKVLDLEGRGTLDALIQGIYFAVDHGARIINMSLSFSDTVDPALYDPLYAAIEYAYAQGTVLVASSGNDGLPRVNPPAVFNECIAVGSVGRDGMRSTFSNFGSTLDVVAPGGDWARGPHQWKHNDAVLGVSVDRGPGRHFSYYWGSGTSQAAAHVSAEAALLMSAGLTDPLQIRNVIQKTAVYLPLYDEIKEGFNAETGAGLIDAFAAVSEYQGIHTDNLDKLPGYQDDKKLFEQLVPTDLLGYASHYQGTEEYYLVMLEDGIGGVYGFTETLTPGNVGVFYADRTVEEIIPFREKIAEKIEQEGGLYAFIEKHLGFISESPYPGGITGFIDGTGDFLHLLDENGGIIAFMDDNGVLVSLIEENGGILSLVDANGALLSLVEGNGGLLSWMDGNGCMLSFMDENGYLTDILGL